MNNTTLVNRIVELEKRLAVANAERDALAATVDALREMAGRANRHLTKGYQLKRFDAAHCNLALSALAEINSFTPQQHLQNLRAEAAKAALLKLADEYRPFGLRHSYTAFDVANHVSAQAEYYANSILKGGVTE